MKAQSACIALGVAAIAGVGSLAGSLGDGLSREGRTILGGDLSFGLIHREVEPAERDFLASRGRGSPESPVRPAQLRDGLRCRMEVANRSRSPPRLNTPGVREPAIR